MKVGVVGATDVRASTWFGREVEYVHGINLLPFTPATELLLDSAFAELEVRAKHREACVLPS